MLSHYILWDLFNALGQVYVWVVLYQIILINFFKELSTCLLHVYGVHHAASDRLDCCSEATKYFRFDIIDNLSHLFCLLY